MKTCRISFIELLHPIHSDLCVPLEDFLSLFFCYEWCRTCFQNVHWTL
jgi:hypothetical protein